MSDPAQGQFSIVRADPLELQAILLPIKDEALRETMRRAYYTVMEGDPSSVSIQFAVFLSGLVHAHNSNGQQPNADQAAGAGIQDKLADILSLQDRSHRFIEASFEKLWRLAQDKHASIPYSVAGQGKPRKWILIALAVCLAILIPVLTYKLGVIAGQSETTQNVARTLYDSAQLGPWISAHHGFLIFQPTKDGQGRLFHTIIVMHPNIQTSNVGLSTDGQAFINMPD